MAADGIYTGFAGPHARLDEPALRLIGVEYAREWLRRFLDDFGTELDRRGRGLTSFLSGWLERDWSFDEIWDLSLAGARSAVIGLQPSARLARAAAVALRASACGYRGEWQLDLGRTTRLRWDHWLLPPADALGVVADGAQVRVSARTNGGTVRAEFRREDREWTGRGAERLPTVPMRSHRLLLLLDGAAGAAELGADRFVLSREAPGAVTHACRQAFAVLAERAPRYLGWVDRVLRGIIPVHSTRSTIKSGSDFNRPGVIHVSFPARTISLAEMLVHEATHQYFQILARLGPVENGSDERLYYSPVRRTGRPIDKILLAYHAFANVLLFYRACAASGRSYRADCAHNEALIRPQLAQLETALRASAGLTPLGRALWEPLALRLA
jgi:HEXXH motif-containing protein